MAELAKSRGGECLTTSYRNLSTKLDWQCKHGHKFSAAPNNVIHQNNRCPTCAGRTLTIQDMRKLAISKGGECLSKEYMGMTMPLTWRCSEGHEWSSNPNSIRNMNHWCPECSGNTPLDITEMMEIAKARGGKVVSKPYKSIVGSLLWECAVGHQFRKRPLDIKHGGQWCPQCVDRLSERLCRAIFESMLKKPFPMRRPSWLLSARGNRMKLDGYCEELKLAFEYQGKQHHQKMPHYFHKQKGDFSYQLEKDETKRELCRNQGVNLIEVPYTVPMDERIGSINHLFCNSARYQWPRTWVIPERCER